MIALNNLAAVDRHKKRQLVCKGCENHCTIARFEFENGNVFFGGNKCERMFSSKGGGAPRGFNLLRYKYDLLFGQAADARADFEALTIGIPRALAAYEHFPFWSALLTGCGAGVVLSSPSTTALYEKGMGTVMSDNICFPAKLVHGHVFDLAEKKVDRILLPMVFRERESAPAHNTFNCPIVTGYAEVVKSAINPKKRWGIGVDAPTVSFRDEGLLRDACYAYIGSLRARGLRVGSGQLARAFAGALAAQQAFKEALRAKGAEVIGNALRNERPLMVLAGRPYHVDPLINQQTAEILTELGCDVVTEDVLPSVEAAKSDYYLSQWGYPARITNAAKWVAAQPSHVRMVQLNSFGCGPDAIITDEVKEVLQTTGKNNNLIRVDEISSTGSIRLRLRSVVEFAKYSDKKLRPSGRPRRTTRLFMPEDRHRVILAPLFSDIYSRLFPPLFKLSGYHMVNLPVTDAAAVDAGMRHANNEVCYPAITVIGDIIKALQSGKYDLSNTAVTLTQTGGQCRASNYLPLIKKAMVNAGFADVPVVSIATVAGLNEQPGFNLAWGKLVRPLLASTICADELSKMHYATVFREVNKGESRRLLNGYLDRLEAAIEGGGRPRAIYRLLAEAVRDFNAVPVAQGSFAKVGVVGEIYLKYNAFANLNIVDWLNSQGVEVIVPSLLDFFVQDFINAEVNSKAHLARRTLRGRLISYALRRYLNRYFRRAEQLGRSFRFYRQPHSIDVLAQQASKIVNLAHQYGEGWLIPGEISAFAHEGVNNVISLQPFGCIANQVISKGVEKRLKDSYPKLNLLFLDFDAGTSEVNVFNRLYFMVKAAKEEAATSLAASQK
ncbi:MAG: acyl-CoA dehydratase activase-related protein [Prevotellaceae bacterium]|jgi:predicted nucleotide-binding protein (sugar kinase/HSP70/actin superfamily)|nr:acyl-CoA dehydratase activase-related protein [Prevotellaceae bacterium]